MNSDRLIDQIGRRFIKEQCEIFPEWGSSLGLQQYDLLLSENTPATHKAHIRLMEKYLAEVEAIPPSDCSGDAWLDRRLLLSQMRIGLLHKRDLQRWRNNPQAHSDTAIGSVFDLILRQPDDWKRFAPAILARLRSIPNYLAAGAACVKEPVPLWTQLAVQSCDGAVPFLKELLTEFPDGQNPEVQEAFAAAIKAFQRFAKVIQNKKPGDEGGFCIGRERFEFLMRENLGLDYSASEAESLGLHWIGKLQAQIAEEAKKFGKLSFEELTAKAGKEWRPAAPSLLEEYQAETLRMRQKFVEKDLMTFPENDRLNVLPVPAFMKHQFPTAAYHAPGPFAKKQQGIFWVNDLSLDAKTPAAKQNEVAQHFGVELTCAHEAYPGHHLQFVLQNRHRSHIRRTAHHPIYYEGWTLWCEKMCVDHKIYDAPLARLTQLHDALWRACRIVIDCRIHTGRATFSQACQLLQSVAGFTLARARADVNWYTSSPTVPMSYLLGRLEVERLHEALVIRGGWSMRRFNDWMLSFGAIPWAWIRRNLVDG